MLYLKLYNIAFHQQDTCINLRAMSTVRGMQTLEAAHILAECKQNHLVLLVCRSDRGELAWEGTGHSGRECGRPALPLKPMPLNSARMSRTMLWFMTAKSLPFDSSLL